MGEDNIEIISKEKPLEESLNKAVRGDGEVVSSSMEPSDIDDKITELKQILAWNKLGCDIKWSIFVSACQSYRVSSCLHPFPPMFIKNQHKDISAVLECINQMPLLSSVLHSQRNSHPPKLYDLIHLLHWLLVEQSPSLEEVPRDQYDSVLNLVSCEPNVVKPDFIFQVQYSPQSSIESNWSKLSLGRKKILHAFHGSRLENFHSILNFGLQQHFNKNSLFGQGIYLSSQLGICLIYSPYSAGWGEENRRRALAQDSLGGEVPHKYYVVENSALVKVKYVLVYTRHKVTASHQVHRHNHTNLVLAWIGRNKFLCFLLGYCILLVLIGLSSNITCQRYYRYCMNKLYEMLGIDIHV
ncbi:hypothetical protein M8J75_000193 [Diaphorina citri]|nr:hypothetical protein M8J75_000193 [Diaphorina citri]